MAKYLIRLDDACPTFHFEKWQLFFDVFDKYGVKPIIAVIPNNESKAFDTFNEGLDFWEEVRKWNANDYEIAFHGYNHVYGTQDKGIIGLENYKSEFAGLPLEAQEEKLRKGQEIFEREQLNPRVFVAPAHTFDFNTLKALKNQTYVSIISDGFALQGFLEYGFNWIPMQLWGPKNKKSGLWTICYHPETAKQKDLQALEQFIQKNRADIITVDDVTYHKLNLKDYTYRYYFFFKIFVHKMIAKLKP
ncbi:DUF2334 domain-containing protein [Flavobacterium sp.]|uniref:DUF2334 domain-containing protein n=1 Tax=Flavobacterium sp. TaxID=239 RepID=UPI00262EC3D7|nr:DUF2334 domain-containing protein [Flavobacterium sp.]